MMGKFQYKPHRRRQNGMEMSHTGRLGQGLRSTQIFSLLFPTLGQTHFQPLESINACDC